LVELNILLVSGSRTIKDMAFVWQKLTEIKEIYDYDTIIEGDAKGVDQDAGLYARQFKINHFTLFPKWDKFGKGAGKIRTKEMVEMCCKGIAIWDGESKGTLYAIKQLKKTNKLLKVIVYEKKT